MIHFDVVIPALHSELEFCCGPEEKVRDLIHKMLVLLTGKKKLRIEKEEEFTLYCMRSACMLEKGATVGKCNIRTGDRLILV